MKILMIYILLHLNFIAIYSQKNADDVIGKWYTPKNQSIVEMSKKNGKFYGKLIWVKEPYDKNGKLKKDEKNPDEKLRDRPLTGMEFMFGFEYTKTNKWGNGKIYNAQDGRMYDAYLSMEDKNTLKVKGYIGFEWLGGTSVWKRVE